MRCDIVTKTLHLQELKLSKSTAQRSLRSIVKKTASTVQFRSRMQRPSAVPSTITLLLPLEPGDAIQARAFEALDADGSLHAASLRMGARR